VQHTEWIGSIHHYLFGNVWPDQQINIPQSSHWQAYISLPTSMGEKA
jgi:hypothetical protein